MASLSSTGLDPAAFPARPAQSYAEAMTRVAALQARDDATVRADSGSRLWTHGAQTARAIVFYHGYTNAPPQYNLLGEQFFQAGYNVLVPRLPHHGLQDPLTTDQMNLTAEELITLTQETTDIAFGLGERVTIAGLSCGGVMAGWAAAFRPDVFLAMGMAPAANFPFVPMWVSAGFRKLAPRLPNFFIWWDPRVKDKLQGPPHAYPRFSTRGLGEIFRMARVLYDYADRQAPLAQHIALTTSAFDTAVSNKTIYKLIARWRKHDPANPTGQIDITYPVVTRMLTAYD
jgi:alpha-beta hydrolase superfamily lysophospholipase